jgi:hypothetical protein
VRHSHGSLPPPEGHGRRREVNGHGGVGGPGRVTSQRLAVLSVGRSERNVARLCGSPIRVAHFTAISRFTAIAALQRLAALQRAGEHQLAQQRCRDSL